MSMNTVQQNVASAAQQLAEQLVAIKPDLEGVTAMYTSEGLGNLQDSDYAELPELAHVTVSEMGNAIGAMNAVLTTLGDFAGGENAYKLLRICHIVP
jgi:hypothetical protein